jgi:hypothetical protein
VHRRGKHFRMDKTTEAVTRQIAAMGCEVFEIGLLKPDTGNNERSMLPRTWDRDALLRSLAWLRHENRDGRNVYIRPKGEHDLSLVDDLSKEAVTAMKKAGFNPAVVIETSPGNYQVWLKHPQQLDRELSTAVARKLAEEFGGDRGAADWRHFGRLAGFTNRKPKYRDVVTGLFPFVRIIEATGIAYPEGARFIADVKQALEDQVRQRERIRARAAAHTRDVPEKSIEVFRNDPRYSGDGNRIDLAYAIYALSHGVSESEVGAAIRSRDLSKKGNQKRQDDYVDRTIKKALARMEMAGRGR